VARPQPDRSYSRSSRRTTQPRHEHLTPHLQHLAASNGSSQPAPLDCRPFLDAVRALGCDRQHVTPANASQVCFPWKLHCSGVGDPRITPEPPAEAPSGVKFPGFRFRARGAEEACLEAWRPDGIGKYDVISINRRRRLAASRGCECAQVLPTARSRRPSARSRRTARIGCG